jgi:hypothetical protein
MLIDREIGTPAFLVLPGKRNAVRPAPAEVGSAAYANRNRLHGTGRTRKTAGGNVPAVSQGNEWEYDGK